MHKTLTTPGRSMLTDVKRKSGLLANMKKYWSLYVMALPGIAFFLLFRYVPLLGSVIAFQDYMIFQGIWGSPWVGFKNFIDFVHYHQFWRIMNNTVIIGLYNLVFVFPAPIVLALMFNEIRHLLYKRFLQTVYYVPHFFSWVVIAGLSFDFLSASGIVNRLRGLFGLEPVLFMQEEACFRSILVLGSIWREAGWGTIVLLAAISAINPETYESAMVDGAGKIRQMFSITLPSIMPTVVVLLLIHIGNFLDLSFEQIYNFLTPMTYPVGDVIDTFVYRTGILEGQYSFTTAIGLFQSVIGLILVVIFNQLARKYQEDGGLW